jgi:hypothetical protein
VMRMRLRSGRLFEGREAQPSVVISTTLAARHWPGTDPVGRRVRFGPVANPTPWFTIIGVVDDVRQNGARSDPRGQMFIPYWHGGRLAIGGTNLVVRTDTAVDTMGQSLRQAIRELDPTLPVSNVAAMTSLVARTIEEPRFLASIATGFAVLAMLLAAVGVYGVTAYAVTSRQQEIGVRIALGATRSNIFALTYGSGFKLMVVGIVVGIAGAAALAPALRTLLFGLEPIDAVTFAGTGAVLLVTSGLAVLIPALRAANVSPAATLRS